MNGETVEITLLFPSSKEIQIALLATGALLFLIGVLMVLYNQRRFVEVKKGVTPAQDAHTFGSILYALGVGIALFMPVYGFCYTHWMPDPAAMVPFWLLFVAMMIAFVPPVAVSITIRHLTVRRQQA